jgi:hypothetical protein
MWRGASFELNLRGRSSPRSIIPPILSRRFLLGSRHLLCGFNHLVCLLAVTPFRKGGVAVPFTTASDEAARSE